MPLVTGPMGTRFFLRVYSYNEGHRLLSAGSLQNLALLLAGVRRQDHFEEISFILRLLSKEISNFKKNQAFREQKKEEAVSDIKLLVNGLKQKRG